jgi:hypothetical protein
MHNDAESVSGTEREATRPETLPNEDPRQEFSPARSLGDRRARPSFEPLRFCPAKQRERHALRAAAAATQPKAAIMTKCLDCVSWEWREVQRCRIGTCPLFALSTRYFGRSEESSVSAAEDVRDA